LPKFPRCITAANLEIITGGQHPSSHPDIERALDKALPAASAKVDATAQREERMKACYASVAARDPNNKLSFIERQGICTGIVDGGG